MTPSTKRHRPDYWLFVPPTGRRPFQAILLDAAPAGAFARTVRRLRTAAADLPHGWDMTFSTPAAIPAKLATVARIVGAGREGPFRPPGLCSRAYRLSDAASRRLAAAVAEDAMSAAVGATARHFPRLATADYWYHIRLTRNAVWVATRSQAGGHSYAYEVRGLFAPPESKVPNPEVV